MPNALPRSLRAALLPLLLLSACAPPPRSERNAPADPPADLNVLFGRTGGAAGRLDGHSIRADGAVLRWEGKYAEENVRAEGRLAPGEVADVWARIEAADFFAQQRQDTATPAYFINVTANGEARRVVWHVPLGEAPPETPLQRLFDDLGEAARGALETAE